MMQYRGLQSLEADLSIMDRPMTRPNSMEFILVASLDQCGLSKRQIDAMANEGYLTLTDLSLNWYSDINMVAKKLGQRPERG